MDVMRIRPHWTAWSLERRAKAGFTLAFIILAGLGVVQYSTARRLIEDSHQTAYANSVLQELEITLNSIANAETAGRGFITTCDTGYLEPYHSAVADARAHYQRLTKFALGRPYQQDRLRKLRPLMTGMFQFLCQAIHLQTHHQLSVAKEFSLLDRERKDMDESRLLIIRMKNEELESLSERRESAEAGHRRTMFLILLGTCAALVLLGGAAFAFGAGNAERQRAESELDRERDLLRTLIDNIPDLVYFKDAASRFTRINKAQARMLGIGDPAEALGKTDFDYFTPEHAQKAFADEQQILRTGEPLINKVENSALPDGRSLWVSTTKMILRDLSGNVIGTFGLSRDISESRRAQEQLEKRVAERTAELAAANGQLERELALRAQAEESEREIQAQFRLLFERNPLPMWVCDAKSLRFLEVNDAVTAQYGYSREEVLGLDLTDLRSSEEISSLRSGTPEAGAELQPSGIRRHRRKDGRIMECEVTSYALSWRGQPAALFIAQDVTQRQSAEKALRESKEELQAILDNSAAVIYVKNVSGEYSKVNRQWERLFKTSVQQATGKNDYEIFPREVAEALRENDARVLEERAPVQFEESVPQEDGPHNYISIKFPLFDSSGEISAVAGISTDITERKRVENEIKQLNGELECRVAERTTQLEQANKELEAFTYTVAHDLRTPLRHMGGFARILIEEYAPELSADAQHYLKRVSEGAEQMGQLVDDLLKFLRIGRLDLHLRSTDLNLTLQSALKQLAPELSGREIEWRLGRLPTVHCDAELIKTVFVNLLSNAVKFTRSREHAVIEAGAITLNQQLVIFIRDNGVGFKMAYSRKLFGMFQRLHRNGDFEGTGVGLATVQRILQRHGWRAWAEAEVDKGATFFFTAGAPNSWTAETEKAEPSEVNDDHARS